MMRRRTVTTAWRWDMRGLLHCYVTMLAIVAAGISFGCKQAEVSVRPHESDINERTSIRNGLLSPDQTLFRETCERVVRGGTVNVPILLDLASDGSPVSWLPPVRPATGSVILDRATLRTVSLYLLEGVRRQRVNHSLSPFLVCDRIQRIDQETRAVAEYHKWWESIERGEQPLYEPNVYWAQVSDTAVRGIGDSVYLPAVGCQELEVIRKDDGP